MSTLCAIPSVLKDNSGKKWNEVLAEQRVREFDTGNMKLDTVGAGSSFRTVVPIDGDIAFFTKESKLVNTAQVFGERRRKPETQELKKTGKRRLVSTGARGLHRVMGSCSM